MRFRRLKAAAKISPHFRRFLVAANVYHVNQSLVICDGKKPPQILAAIFRRFYDPKNRRKGLRPAVIWRIGKPPQILCSGRF
jgi:hypothetical protein